ncbi:MAG: SDR family NAD(P)-dependent oxidoreductase [Erythrobacter sp.]|nr:SDR family NAD(P)-dependent oxidoreductase [Erythrobacter sp.]MDZ4136135.1 SDR family NAD(P)-dependent oxidoreductase [Paracoccaceae bacterium]MDZ4273070.1 SDR family NAD(P)-dependent oxidoreductase [Erythrobacter sp.]
MTPFANKVAIVTGASTGIGEATARLLAQRGAIVVLAARREEMIAALAGEILGAGGTASFIRTDVSDAGEVEAMVAHAIDTHGRLDIAVNNAGIGAQVHSIVELPDDYWDSVLNTNLKGNFLCLKHQARAMVAAGNGGAIINVGSVNTFLGCPGAAAYCASKAGQLALTTSASAELAAQGIRVNLVCPGVTDTPLHRQIKGNLGTDAFEGLKAQTHQRRIGDPVEIARAIAFLASDEASFITGTTLTADGGFHMTL